MIRKIALLAAGILMFLSVANAQNTTAQVRAGLSVAGEKGAQASVTEQGAAASIIKSLEASQRPLRTVNGYRISIFFDNSQYARSKANEAIAMFKEIYPDIPTYTSYNTSYKVAVGNCITETEAIMLWGKIKNNFANAVKVSEDIPIDQLLEPVKATAENPL